MTVPTTESTSGKTLRDLMAPLFRRKRRFTLVFGAMTVGTIVAAVILSSIYQASMEVIVNEDRLDPLVTAQATPQAAIFPQPITDQEVNSEIQILQSPDVLQQVVLANHLQDKERKGLVRSLLPAHDDSWYVSRATRKLAAKLDISQLPKTNLIQVNYKSNDPELAYSVLQKLGSVYLEKHLAVRRPQGSYAFFEKQTQNYHQALAESEKRLEEFNQQSKVAVPELEKNELAQQVVTAIGALHAAQQSIAANQQRVREEEARMKNTPARSTAQEATDSAQALLQQLQANLLAAQIKKTQLVLKYDPTYPLVQEADQEIAQTQAALDAANKQHFVNQTTDRDPAYELMREDVTKTRAELDSAQATAVALEQSIASMQSQMVDLDQKSLRQADLQRDVKANEGNYLLYLSKREQERASDAMDERRIGNVAIAVPPTVPILPWLSPVLVIAVGLFLALFVSTAVVFLSEYLDSSLRTPSEVAEVLRIPVLASVPKQRA